MSDAVEGTPEAAPVPALPVVGDRVLLCTGSYLDVCGTRQTGDDLFLLNASGAWVDGGGCIVVIPEG